MSKATLLDSLVRLFKGKIQSIDAIRQLYQFVTSAALEAAHGDGISLFGRLNAAGKALPTTLDALDALPGLKQPEARVPLYLRANLFVALMAEVEEMLAELMREVLVAFPGKIKIEKIPKDILVDASSRGEVVLSVAGMDVDGAFYQKPADYRKRIEDVTSMPPSVLEPFWEKFIENKATRDVGLHNGWRINETYRKKAGSRARSPSGHELLVPDEKYFLDACDNAAAMLLALKQHCLDVFKECRPVYVFRDMWNRAVLSNRVKFDKVWQIIEKEGRAIIVRIDDEKHWGWSGSEQLLFDFFCHVFDSRTPADFAGLFRRWSGSPSYAVVTEWLDAPFLL